MSQLYNLKFLSSDTQYGYKTMQKRRAKCDSQKQIKWGFIEVCTRQEIFRINNCLFSIGLAVLNLKIANHRHQFQNSHKKQPFISPFAIALQWILRQNVLCRSWSYFHLTGNIGVIFMDFIAVILTHIAFLVCAFCQRYGHLLPPTNICEFVFIEYFQNWVLNGPNIWTIWIIRLVGH